MAGHRHGPGRIPEKPKNFKGTITKLFRCLGRYRLPLVLVLVLALASTAFGIVGPKILSTATTELATGLGRKLSGLGGIDFGKIGKILLTVLALYLVSAACSFFQSWILAGITQLRALQREQPAARGEMAAVDDVDAPFFQLTRRETGVLIGAREVRADVDVDDVHPLGEDREEEVEELLRADGRGLRERSAAAERLVEVLGGVAPVVEEGLLPLNDRQRDHADLKPLQKRRREVAGAVIGNTNRSCHG